MGTRPEIIRLSAVITKCRRYFDTLLAHTGQNYDYNLNGIFFRDLKNVRLVWTLMVDGKATKNGQIDQLDIAPQQFVDLLIPADLTAAYEGEPMLKLLEDACQ